MRILLVEDYPLLVRSITRMLTGDRHQVDVATTEPEALGRLSESTYDMVLSDYEIHDSATDHTGDGVVVLKHTAAVQPGAVRILMSGNPGAAHAALVASGIEAHFLHKPFTFDELREILRTMDREP